jgi:hypothetical protein
LILVLGRSISVVRCMLGRWRAPLTDATTDERRSEDLR